MADTTKKDIKAWLLDLEKDIGKPIIVALLVEKGQIGFVSCTRKKAYLESSVDIDDDEDDEPERAEKLPKGIKFPESPYIS